MRNDTEDDALVRQMLDMTESDLSILRAALNQKLSPPTPGGFGRKSRDVNLATLNGSANDLLWSKFEQRGWLSSVNIPGLTEGQPAGVLPSRAYSLLNQGRAPVLELLAKRDAAHSERSSNNSSKIKALGKFHDDRSEPFIAEMIAAVRAAGGDLSDVALLGSVFLKSTVRAIAKRGQEDKVLDDISRMTRNMLAREDAASSGS